MLSYDIQELIPDLKNFENTLIETYSFVQKMPDEVLSYIKKLARASSIGSSTRIENAQLTDLEVNWLDTILETDGHITAFEANRALIENKLSKDRERSYEEVAGCRAMLQVIFEEGTLWRPLRETNLRALHEILLSPYSKAGPTIGQYKVQPNSVAEVHHATKVLRTVFKTADAGPITSTAMRDLLDWYNQEIDVNPWSIAVASEFVFRFLAIHPFQDGNGRLGRGLFILSLLQSNHTALRAIVPLIAMDRHIEKRREEYYLVLNRCSKGAYRQNPTEYHIKYFLKFMLKVTTEALKDVGIYFQRYTNIQKLSPSAQAVYTCFHHFPELRLTNQKIAEEIKLPSRTIAYCLGQLVKFDLIQKYGEGAGVRYQMTF